jgi:dephospho-CoA kinase
LISNEVRTLKTLGVTGTSGSGKSLFCSFFKDYGASVINCDGVYHRMLKESVALNADILALFPEAGQNGMVDRKALSRIVFADEAKLRKLEAAVFPHITREIKGMLEEFEKKGAALAVLDAPTLFESGANKLCDRVVAVCAPQEAQIERLYEREGLSREDAEKRIASRPPDSFYEKKGCLMVYNDGSFEKIRSEAERIFALLRD